MGLSVASVGKTQLLLADAMGFWFQCKKTPFLEIKSWFYPSTQHTSIGKHCVLCLIISTYMQ